MNFSKGQRIQLLRKPGFAIYLAACFLATFGSGLCYLSTNWLILTVSNQVSTMIGMMICFWLPNALLGPFWGVIVDRYSRRWALILSNTMRGAILFLFSLYLLHHGISVHDIDLLMLIFGALFGMIWPASVALIREIVAPEDLLNANTMVDMVYEMGNLAGMGGAGLLLKWLSATQLFALSGAVFFLSAFAMFFLRIRTPIEKKSYTNISQDFILGFHYLIKNKTLSGIYTVQLLILAAVMITPILLAPFAKNILHANVSQFGLIQTSLSVGVIVGGISLPYVLKRIGLNKSLFFLVSLLALLYFLFAFNTWVFVSTILYFVIGVALASWPLVMTKAQDVTQPDFQGRVQSVFSSLSGIIVLLAYVLVDAANHFMSVNWLYLLPSLLALSALLLAWKLRAVW